MITPFSQNEMHLLHKLFHPIFTDSPSLTATSTGPDKGFPCHPSFFSNFLRFTPHFVDLFPPFTAQITKIRRCFHLFAVRRFAQSLFSLSFLPCCFQHLPCLRLLSFLHCFGIAFPSAVWYNNPHRITLRFSHHFIYLRK